jgi:hypothetical protein
MMNYAELEQSIKDWLNKPNLGTVLPMIIRFGQRDLEDNLRIRPMEYHPDQSTLSIATGSISIPSDYLELIYLNLIDGSIRYPVEYRVDIKEMYSVSYDTAEIGLPLTMTRIADNLVFDVETDAEYTLDWCYYRRLPTLVSTYPYNTNWWSLNAEEAFLMSCLNKASLYVTGISKEDKDKWASALLVARENLHITNSRESSSGVILRTVPWSL